MKFCLLFFLNILMSLGGLGSETQKVQSTFFDCAFGKAQEHAVQILDKAEMKYTVGKSGDLFLSDVEVADVECDKVGLIFSPISGNFYSISGSKSYKSKAEAYEAYDKVLSIFRGRYPRIQIIRKPIGAEKMSTYLDNDNGFYVGLFKSRNKEGEIVYYVKVNFWNIFEKKQIAEAVQ